MYLDGGGEVVRDRLKKWLATEVRHAVESQGAGNFKSSLQQYAQRELSSTPVYRMVRESGPDHRKSFLIAAVIADRQFTAAWGSNKKDAEQRAASNALAELHDQPIPYPAGLRLVTYEKRVRRLRTRLGFLSWPIDYLASGRGESSRQSEWE